MRRNQNGIEVQIVSITQLLPTVQAMPRAEKIQLIQWIATQLAQDEGVVALSPDVKYALLSPSESHEAASVLSAFLEQEKAARK